jgi:hypothetical protein
MRSVTSTPLACGPAPKGASGAPEAYGRRVGEAGRDDRAVGAGAGSRSFDASTGRERAPRGDEKRRDAPLRLVPPRANTQPAFGCYLALPATEVALAPTVKRTSLDIGH